MLDKASLTAASLAAVLEQSVDCVKLIDPQGKLVWVNPLGMCAMEIDDFCSVESAQWENLWPEAMRNEITAAYKGAAAGEVVRFTGACPTAKGTPRFWDVSVSSVRDESGEMAGYVAISRDITQGELDREAQTILLREMRHRLANAYAIVGSLIQGMARNNPERKAFAQEMSTRIAALAAAQSMFDQHEDRAALKDLVTTLTKPFDDGHCPVTISAPAGVTIDRRSADALALVLGELGVNAAKHGAVAHGGTVAVTVAADDDAVRLNWCERSTRKVAAQNRDGGQGLTLIRRILAARGGTLTIEWAEYGLDARLEIPLA